MPKSVRFNRAWSHDEGGGVRRTFPAGWAGNLAEDVADAALKDGAAEVRAGPALAAVAENRPSENMTRAELEEMARARGIDPSDHRTKADLAAAIDGA